MRTCLAYSAAFILSLSAYAEEAIPSYAQMLGWGPEDKVVILHIDDVGMSHSTNRGTIKAMEKGVANSCSIMMPCSWVSEYFHYLQKNPTVDAGLHLTMTSEWKEYRWGPVAGKAAVPGLVDNEGCLHRNVLAVVQKASADEVEKEIRAQIDRAETMGFEITHLDSHMGALFADQKFMERYIKVGVEKQIPIMFMGGHLQFLLNDLADDTPYKPEQIRAIAKQIWDAGLPVLDDLHNMSYGWKRPEKVKNLLRDLRAMKPGLTKFIFHCTDPTEEFPIISDSGPSRVGDLEAMLDPRVRRLIEDQGIILTTYREIRDRRKKLQAQEQPQSAEQAPAQEQPQ